MNENIEINEGNEKSESNINRNKSVIKRLSIIIGQLEGIKRMTQEGRDCSEVLVQMSAVKSALNSTAKLILEDHINYCIEEAIEKKDKDALSSLNNALNKFIN